MPRWFKVRELEDLKVVISRSVVVVMVVAFLGYVIEWENGTGIAFMGVGIAMVIAAVTYMMRSQVRSQPHAD